MTKQGFAVRHLAILAALLLLTCAGGTALGWALSHSTLLADAAAATATLPAAPGATPAAPAPISADDLQTRIELLYERAGASVVTITSRSLEYDFFLNPVPREGSGSGFFMV